MAMKKVQPKPKKKRVVVELEPISEKDDEGSDENDDES